VFHYEASPRVFALLKIAWKGEAPAEPQIRERVILLVAQQELSPSRKLPILKQAKALRRASIHRSKRALREPGQSNLLDCFVCLKICKDFKIFIDLNVKSNSGCRFVMAYPDEGAGRGL